EAALRQAPVERHLAALEAVDGDARARALALHAAAAGLAGARADAAADALARLGRAFVVTQFVEFHLVSPRPALRPRPRRGRDAGRWRSCRARTGCHRACGGDAAC